MQVTRILGIAPYEGMQNLMKQVAAKRTDVELTAFVGDLEEGARIAQTYTIHDFDVIISRGGTAERIRQQTLIPVVEVPLTIYDMLRSIKLAENYDNKYAIIGFPSITKNARFLCDILQYSIDIYTIHTEEEALLSLETISQKGYNMVLCDMITSSLAKRFGLPVLLIASGTESMETAIDLAIQTSSSYRKITDEVKFYQNILEEQQAKIFVYKPSGELVYQVPGTIAGSSLCEKMFSSISVIMQEKQKRIYYETAGNIFVLRGVCKTISDQTYVIYFVTVRKSPLTLAKNGIYSISKEEAYDKFFNSFYSIAQSASVVDMTLDQFAQSSHPLMILGEIGTGKEQMVRLIYAKSNLSNNPLVTIDCARLHEKGWSFLLENDQSPLSDTNITLYIKSIDSLSQAQFEDLFNTIKDLNVHQRNRLLFTCSYHENNKLNERTQRIIQMFSCLTFYMPTLRSLKKDIPNLASLYISILNVRMAKEIIGFEPNALSLLQSYDWFHNFDQFKRVINELVTITEQPYISLDDVTKLLKNETHMMYTVDQPTHSSLDLNRTLEKINLDIVQRVLVEEKGNQGAVSKRLGISRTTLWRMLQKVAPTHSSTS